MKEITFITGNQGKADYLSRYLGYPVKHTKIDLDELHSLDLREIVEHKVRQAFDKVKEPVIVEDVSLEFSAFGKLPGPFIRFFVDEMPQEDICAMLTDKKREAVAKCVFGFFDGKTLRLFEGMLEGKIASSPAGDRGYGWDRYFIPQGYDITRAELSEEDDQKTYLQLKPFEELKQFLLTL